MAGHSKWANIKHTKSLMDKKRGKLFSKLSRDISVAVKLSGSENSALAKLAIEKAKAANMPKDKIMVAIDRGLGRGKDTEVLYENTYEAYAPGNVACLIDTQTDNPNRTLTEIKTIVNKSGGKFLSSGSVSWMFDEVGRIIVDASKLKDTEAFTLSIMEAEGLLDVSIQNDQVEIITEKEKLNSIQELILNNYPETEFKEVEIIKKPKKENVLIRTEICPNSCPNY
ncbi:MAG: putative transcriptional regulatory protein [Candidatus Dojkabacteria bacterium]|nr:MAG: putative transcriptional regulatory protein [Candidatus Dojkabacteria bacterium]